MIEILVLLALTSRIGKIVEAKGHKSGGYKWGTVGLWFGGELLGALVGGVFSGLSGSSSSDMQCAIYIFALLGAAVGAFIAFTIAKNAQPVPGFQPVMATAGTGTSAAKLADLQNQLNSGRISVQEYEMKKAEIFKQG